MANSLHFVRHKVDVLQPHPRLPAAGWSPAPRRVRHRPREPVGALPALVRRWAEAVGRGWLPRHQTARVGPEPVPRVHLRGLQCPLSRPPGLPFDELDYLYMSCPDVAADMAWFRDALGARIVFAIEDSGTRVAMLELTSGPPRVLLTDHLEGERPILIYRVERLESVVTALESRGLQPMRKLEIPFGPCAVLARRAVSGWPSTNARGRGSRTTSRGATTSEPPPRPAAGTYRRRGWADGQSSRKCRTSVLTMPPRKSCGTARQSAP